MSMVPVSLLGLLLGGRRSWRTFLGREGGGIGDWTDGADTCCEELHTDSPKPRPRQAQRRPFRRPQVDQPSRMRGARNLTRAELRRGDDDRDAGVETRDSARGAVLPGV